MPHEYHVSQGQIIVRATFVEPETGIFTDAPALSRYLLRRLGPFGLRLADMKMEWGDQTLSEIHLRSYLFNFRVTLTIRAERVEFACNLPGADREATTAAFWESLNAIKEHLPNSAFAGYSTDVVLHGKVAGSDSRTFTERYTQNVPDLGPPLGSGTVFYFGPEKERLTSTMTADLSALVPDGLFIRSLVNWDATKVSAQDLPKAVAEHLERGLDALGLPLRGLA